MRIIISPAKKMKVDSDTLKAVGTPVFLRDTEQILEWMRTLSYDEAKELWCCSDTIAKQNFQRIAGMDLEKSRTPAILAYEGIQYQYMAPAVFEEGMLSYVQEHLRILSGFYGVLKPMDPVTPYRLEMQAKAQIDGKKDLYEFWGSRLLEEVTDQDHTVINLASKEYSRCIELYLKPEDTFITCIFGEEAGGRVVQKGTYAKMARGEMVRFLAEQGAGQPEKMKEFNRLNYVFAEELSSETEYVFLRNDRSSSE